MKRRTIESLEACFAHAAGVLRGEPASDSEIDAAESRLRCKFDPDYREFLRLFGCGMVGADPIFGIGAAPEAMGLPAGVVEVTERFRSQAWPGVEDWYIVSEDARGNPIGVAPDGTVRLSDHDVGDVPIIADNFEAYLLECLRK